MSSTRLKFGRGRFTLYPRGCFGAAALTKWQNQLEAQLFLREAILSQLTYPTVIPSEARGLGVCVRR